MNEKKSSPYSRCSLCGRSCGIDRSGGERGFCGMGPELRIAWAGIHRGEEPVICGAGGSGAVFFSGCTLQCFFCQNRQISRDGMGREVSIPDFADICLSLRDRGAENINLVTGGHFLPSIARGIALARRRGLGLPVVWNSSGYDGPGAVEALADFVDVFVPDLKTLDGALASALFGAPDYPGTVRNALTRMAAARPLSFSGDSLRSGLIVRHLVLPGLMDNTREVLAWFSENLKDRALISVMFQYTPMEGIENAAAGLPGSWSRRVSRAEYHETLRLLDLFHIQEGFIQEPPGPESLTPEFSRAASFPGNLAEPVWFHRGTAAS